MKIYIAIYDQKKKQDDFPLQMIKTSEQAMELNLKGYGIFGTVNSFNSRRIESDVKKLEAFYVDFDGAEKKEQLESLKNFLMPSMIVESKNGYHCYWMIKDDIVKEFGVEMANTIYKEINKRLIYWLGSGADEGVYDCARVLRVPGFNHMKDFYSPFPIEEVFSKEIKYTVKEMLLWLKPRPAKTKKTYEPHDIEFSGDNFWESAHAIDCQSGLATLSGTSGVNGDSFDVIKGQIYVNDERSQCWIDRGGLIGSHSNGGPTIPNWVNWYHNDWVKTAEILNNVFPELSKPTGITLGFID